MTQHPEQTMKNLAELLDSFGMDIKISHQQMVLTAYSGIKRRKDDPQTIRSVASIAVKELEATLQSGCYTPGKGREQLLQAKEYFEELCRYGNPPPN